MGELYSGRDLNNQIGIFENGIVYSGTDKKHEIGRYDYSTGIIYHTDGLEPLITGSYKDGFIYRGKNKVGMLDRPNIYARKDDKGHVIGKYFGSDSLGAAAATLLLLSDELSSSENQVVTPKGPSPRLAIFESDFILYTVSIIGLFLFIYFSYLISEYAFAAIGNFGKSLLNSYGWFSWKLLYQGIMLVVLVMAINANDRFMRKDKIILTFLLPLIMIFTACLTFSTITNFTLYQRLVPLSGISKPGLYAFKTALFVPLVTFTPTLLPHLVLIIFDSYLEQSGCEAIVAGSKVIFWFSVPLSFVMFHTYISCFALKDLHIAGMAYIPIIVCSFIAYAIYYFILHILNSAVYKDT